MKKEKDSDMNRLAHCDNRVPNHQSGDLEAPPLESNQRHPLHFFQRDISMRTFGIAAEMIAHHRLKAWVLEICDAIQVRTHQAMLSRRIVPALPATTRTKNEMS
jgi:hypothetical protein